MNIGDLFLGLRIDPSGDLKTAVTKSAEDAGKAGGLTLGKAMSVALKGAALSIGAALAVATKGAGEAEAAQGKFMAATGKSREEAKQFVSGMDSLAGSAGAVGMSFEDIASAGTMVEQQFGTTGKATTDLTEKILEFSKITGGDATANAAQLEDTLSSFGKTAADAGPLLDVMTVSAQKFGTTDMLPTLQAMSPALQAMGADLDDGAALLNAFEVAGVDASAAQKGLNSAITKLPAGQTLEGFIQHLQDLKNQGVDPTSEAIKVFGNKAGAGLALTLKPGGHALDDYRISAQDAAGATDKAADNMLTFADRIRGFADKALAGAREIGNEFGPALTGLGSLVTLAAPFARGIGSLLVEVAKRVLPLATIQGALVGGAMAEGEAEGAAGAGAITKIGARIAAMGIPLAAEGTTVGTAVGAAMAAAIPLGILAVGGAAIAAALLVTMGDAKNKIENDPQSINNVDLFQARAPMWAKAKINVAQQMQALGQASLDAFNKTWNAGIANGMDANDPALLAAAKAAGEAVGNQVGTSAADALPAAMNAGVADHADELAAETSALAKSQADAYEETVKGNRNSLSLWEITREKQVADTKAWRELWDSSARAITGDIVGALKDAKDNVGNAMKDLMWALNHPLAMQKQLTEIQADLNSKALARGLSSQYPWIQDAAKQQQQKWLDEWKQLDPKGYAAAHAASSSVQDGLNDGYPGALSDGRTFVQRFNDIFAGLKKNYGVNVSVAAGLAGKLAHMPQFAEGGHLPAWTTGLVGEKGPEFVRYSRDVDISPTLTAAAGAAPGGGLTFNGDINIHAPDGSAQSIKSAVMDAFGEILGSARNAATIRPSEAF